MKRILGVLAVVAFVATIVSAVEVKSENVAGVVNVSVPAASLAMVGVNLDGFDGTPTLESLFGSQVVAASDYLAADRIFVWDTASSQYNRFAKYDGDGLWYRCNNSTEWDQGTVQTNLMLTVGSGAWIRCNPLQAQTFALRFWLPSNC